MVPKEIIGYVPGPSGLNNQTIAFLGLISFAKNYNFPISIPRFVNFSTGYLKPHEAMGSTVAMREIFDVDRLKDFLSEYGIQASEDQSFVNKITMGQMFWLGMEIDATGRFERNGLSAKFWSALQPSTKLLKIIEKIEAEAFAGQGIDAVLQVRLEPDIKRFFEVKSGDSSRPVTYRDLMETVSDEVGGKVKNILLACDETHFKTEEMKDVAKQFGFQVTVKSEILNCEVEKDDFLSRSVIDFYLAARTNIFIGAVYSTFAKIAFSMHYATAQNDDWSHYTYHFEHRKGDKLTKHSDPGSKKLITLPDSTSLSKDKKSPLKLMTHVGMLGDLVSDYGWSFQQGEGFEIQGFDLASEGSRYQLFYRAKLDDGVWTDWVSEGFVGTRGKARPLKGYSLKILDRQGAPVRFMAAAKFTSGYFCTMEEAGDLVAKMPDDLLCGMQVFFSPEPDKLDNQKFIYGKNDILFLNADTNGVMKQITGATVPTPSFLTALARLHKERRQRCTAMGIEYFHIIVPNKETSLRAYLPDEFVFEAFGPTPARRYLESDKEILDFTFYDPDILAQSAVPTDFYPKQNSHWNNAGAVKYFSAALYALHAQDANNITQLKFQTITKNEVGDLGLHASSQAEKFNDICAVSYTHLTLPTKRIV